MLVFRTICQASDTRYECFGIDEHVAVFSLQCRLSEKVDEIMPDAPDEEKHQQVVAWLKNATLDRIVVATASPYHSTGAEFPKLQLVN